MLQFRCRHTQHVLTAVGDTVIEAPSIQQIDVARVVQTWYALRLCTGATVVVCTGTVAFESAFGPNLMCLNK